MTPDRIRQLREDLGLSQRELARLLNVTHPTIGKWERGVTSPSQTKVAMMKQLRRKAEDRGNEFVRELLKIAAGGMFIVLLSKLFGGEE